MKTSLSAAGLLTQRFQKATQPPLLEDAVIKDAPICSTHNLGSAVISQMGPSDPAIMQKS